MPKIIEGLRQRLVAEARRQAKERGYGAVTVRSVSAACGVGLGTLYNYFSSKDMLIATFMLEDWLEVLDALKKSAEEAAEAEAVVTAIHEALQSYIAAHRFVLQDPAAIKVFCAASAERHQLMASQLSALLLPYCRAAGYEDPAFIALFLSENLLSFSGTGRPLADLAPIFDRILKA